MKKYYTILLLLALMSYGYAQSLKDQVNWPVFMQKQSLKYDSISTNYYTGLILGNGLLGTNIYKENEHSIRFDIGRSDVVDNRTAQYPTASKLYTRARLPIGYLSLKTLGKITGATMELDIYNATAKGTIFTDKGQIHFITYVAAQQNVININLNTNGGESRPIVSFLPDKSISPRYQHSYPQDKPANFIENPAIQKTEKAGYNIYHQSLLNKGGYATVYQTTPTHNNGLNLQLTVSFDANNTNDEVSNAIHTLKEFNTKSAKEQLQLHQNWWHNYYQQSYVALPDRRMESFYWIQLYKLACITRAELPMIDLMGPWTNPTPWPAIWWNLNVQLTYAPIFTANHLELGKSLFNTFNNNEQNLIQNVPAQWQNNAAAIGRSSSYDLISKISAEEIKKGTFEPANLTWALFYYYQYYAYSGDKMTLKQKIYPLLKRSTNFMINLLTKDEKGVFHFPMSYSPEYKSAEDANYALASIRWALTTLIQTSTVEGLNDSEVNKWKVILKDLAPYPQNETGLMIGKDVALTTSHRHYSHLLMIYPYHLLNWEQIEHRALIEQSLQHWLSLKGALQGYTFTGSASMYATMGNGDKSYELLNELFNKYIQPNTLYRESGPVIETPLAAASTIQELLLQSWGNKIRVFPAIPKTWNDVTFKQLRAEGAFLISAERQNGSTQNIVINSTNGGQCTLITDMEDFVLKSNKRPIMAYNSNKIDHLNQINFNTLVGETITLSQKDKPSYLATGVNYQYFKDWSWGLKKKTSINELN